jgi:hypothetical protein
MMSSAPEGFKSFFLKVNSLQTTKFRWKTLFEAKSLATKGVDGPAYDFKAPYDTEPSTIESTGDTV